MISEDPGSILTTYTSIPRDLTPSSGPKALRRPPIWYTDKTFKQTIHTHKIIITIIILLPLRRLRPQIVCPTLLHPWQEAWKRRLRAEPQRNRQPQVHFLGSFFFLSHIFNQTSTFKRLDGKPNTSMTRVRDCGKVSSQVHRAQHTR